MSNVQKTPFARSMGVFVENKANDEIGKQGLALPGHVLSVDGAIVTVNFDVQGLTIQQVTMPLFGPEYIRYPVQAGDLGYAIPGDAYLGGVSGLGGGVADNTLRGNLSSLVWFPIANKKWTVPPGADANTLALYGKTSTLLLDSISGNSSAKLASNGIALAFGGGSITMNSSGITLSFGGHQIVIDSSAVHIDGKPFLAHQHSDPQGGNTGPVV